MNLSKKCLIIFSLFYFFSCDMKKEIIISGKTMGTFYNIRVVGSIFQNSNNLKQMINNRLKEVNQSMSTFDPESEISKFNNINDEETELEISNDFYHVLLKSQKIYNITSGAWDATIKPLVNLWGFGNTINNLDIPDKKKIDELIKNVGFNNIILKKNRIKKLNKNISINLASIAKGYGVDVISCLLKENNIENFLVEIGGEVYASGTKKDGGYWRIGINNPAKNASLDDIYEILTLKNCAIATSGNYRNFFEINNTNYSHIINPATGWPVNNNIVSASVIADDCMFADGLATALMVIGVDKGINLIDNLENVECMIIIKNNDNKYNDFYSSNFKSFIAN